MENCSVFLYFIIKIKEQQLSSPLSFTPFLLLLLLLNCESGKFDCQQTWYRTDIHIKHYINIITLGTMFNIIENLETSRVHLYFIYFFNIITKHNFVSNLKWLVCLQGSILQICKRMSLILYSTNCLIDVIYIYIDILCLQM